MGDVKMRRENIRYEARGKSFELFLDARGRLDGLLRGEAVMAYVERTVAMNTADAIDPGIAAGEWTRFRLRGVDPVIVKQVRHELKDVDGPCAETDRN